MTKHEVADALREIAVLLELRGENAFKVRAYTNGARVLEDLPGSLEERVAAGTLGELPGFGDALVDKVARLATTGRLPLLDELRAATPPGFLGMLAIPGLGPKKIRALHAELGIDNVAALEAACRDGRVAAVAGFGEKTQQKLLEGIRNREAYAQRHLWVEVAERAQPLVGALARLPGVLRAEAAGSFRRGLETVGDLDLLASTHDGAGPTAWFVGLPGVREVVGSGPTKTSVRFEDGLQADLRIVPPAQFAFALHHFTGSKEHNVQMRQRALARGLTLGEWGLQPIEGDGPGVAAASEADLFAALGLARIPPELREGRGEIEAAEAGALPHLVTEGRLRGALHNHTDASDGRDTLEDMAAAAEALGWDYLGIADHSRSSRQARGLEIDRLRRQVDAIRALNASGRFRCRVLAGSEVDILPDGALDYPDDVLAELDYVVASVHSALGQPVDTMTARLIAAASHPRVHVLGHLTGRLLLRREPSAVDIPAVIAACARHGTAIELNANPWRLDLDWRFWRQATAAGVLCCINPDAHAAADLLHVGHGVRVARKAWMTPEQVLNTRNLEGMLAWLA